MFVPVSYLAQTVPLVNTQEDLIRVLDMFILPQYPDLMTKNPAYTKQECFGVVLGLMQAARLHIRFKPVEIEKAVDAFLEDRLWVSKEQLAEIELAPNATPRGYMHTPSFLRMAWIMVVETGKWLRRLWHLLKIAVQHRYYYTFCAERKFKVPRSPAHPERMAALPTRKDS